MKDRSKIRDLTGQRFGRLTVVGLKETETRKTFWICQCDCGGVKEVRSDSLLRGSVKSCGCLKKDQDKTNLHSRNHKMADELGFKRGHTRIYTIWQGMRNRCENKHDPRYDRYGGRGIAVCEEWKNDFVSFYNWALENGYAEDLTIDRIDNNGNYCPENCRWATQEQQARNRSSNVNITIGNATKTLTEWCEIFELNYSAVQGRYQRNGFISIDDLFNRS